MSLSRSYDAMRSTWSKMMVVSGGGGGYCGGCGGGGWWKGFWWWLGWELWCFRGCSGVCSKPV